MTPAEQTAQALKILVALVVTLIVGAGAYLYVHHRVAVNDREQACLDYMGGGRKPSYDCRAVLAG